MAMTASTLPPPMIHPFSCSSSNWKCARLEHLSSPSPTATAELRLTSDCPKRGSKAAVIATAVSGGYTETIGDALWDIPIFTASGESVMFNELWDQNEGKAVVALLRHFGCFCCWEFASSLRDAKSRFDASGVKLIAIGVGTPDKARILAERLPFPMDCLYADPTHKVYDFLGLYFGIGRTLFNPASAKIFSRFDAVRKATENYTISATPDDASSVLQQGGMFVFQGRKLIYGRKDEATGDHAPLTDVFNICCKQSE